ncbi:MAG: hypothetical protein ACREMY_12210, partial [bacterium]
MAKYVAFLIAIGLFGSLYVLSENGLYWSDYNWWFAGAQTLRNMTVMSPLAPFLAVWNTFNWKDNLLYALPILPPLLAFGASRLAYELAVLLAYAAPYAVSIAVLACACTGISRKIFWPVLIAALFPAVWAPALRGLPDSAGAFLLTLALLIFSSKEQSARRALNCLAVGVLLAFAVLIRRHFLLAIPAFFIAAATQYFLQRRLEPRADAIGAEPGLRSAVRQMLLVAAGFAAIICTLGLGFIQQLSLHNYAILNSSYRVSIFEEIVYFLTLYGVPVWIMATAGWVLVFRSRRYV